MIDYRAYPILYVDDETANLVAVRYALEDEFTFITTAQPEEALRILAERDVAILLADQRMPGMTGSELCARARTVRPETVRIIMTAYADLHAAIDAINRGQVTRYLAKPFRNEELAEVLRTALDLVHIQRTVRELEFRLLRSGPNDGASTAQSALMRELDEPISVLAACIRRTADLTSAAVGVASDPERVVALLESAQSSHTEALSVIERLTDVMRRSVRGQEPAATASRCDAARVVDSTVRILRPEVQKSAHLQVIIEAAPMVPMEASALSQVVMNLLLNAAQSAPRRETHQLELEVRVSATPNEATILVSDNGDGIPPELTERVFDPFFTTKNGAGGMGLSIVRSLVLRAGGRAEVVSTVGEGSRFRVTLPIANG